MATEKLFKAKMSTKGQLVIPKNIRNLYGLREGDELILIPIGEGVLIKGRGGEGRALRGLLKDLDIDVRECELILKEAKKTLVKVRA